MPARPQATEYAPFYAGYVASVRDGDIRDIVREGKEELAATLGSIPESRGGYAYAEGKWSIKTVIGHMIDAERIFSYRVLRLARGDKTPLPGFEENSYAATARSDERTVADLAAEMLDVRVSTIRLLDSIPDDAWERSAMVSIGEATVRAIAYILIGHARHHLKVLRERYGVGG